MFPQGRTGHISSFDATPTYLVVRPVFISGFKPQLTRVGGAFPLAAMSCALNLDTHPTTPGGCGVDAPRPILSCRLKEIVG